MRFEFTYGGPPFSFKKFRYVDRKWGPLLLNPFPKAGGGRGIFSVQDLCDLSVYEISRILLSICSVTPFLDQVFRCFFSMDNLRVYGEDDAVSSSGLGRSSTKLPSSSEGLPVPTSFQALGMAASTPTTTLVTSGPVPAVSAPTAPASSVHKDCTVALDDLPSPPPPAEPYEAFLARVSRELSSLPIRSAQLGAAVPPRPVVATSTTGSRLPTPFPRYEDSSWALQPQAPGGRIRMPLPASCYAPPPSPWVWPGRGPAVDVAMIRGPLPTTLPTGPPGLPGPSGLRAGPPAVGPAPVPPPSTPSTELKKHLSSPLRFRGFFRGPRPLLSPLRHRPVWTLLLFRRRHKTLEPSLKDLPQRWF